MQSSFASPNQSKSSFKPVELAHRFSSKADFIRYFKEHLQYYVPPPTSKFLLHN